MGHPIRSLTLKGYKSIRDLEGFKLDDVNVLIGANGSGKSNFVSFFYLLRELVAGRLEKAINKAGGADKQLFLGPKVTEKIECRLEFGWNSYAFTLEPTTDNRLIFGEERIEYQPDEGMQTQSVDHSLGEGHSESKLKSIRKDERYFAIAQHVYKAVSSWTVYHVHDTCETAKMRRYGAVEDNERLRPDAGNLAAFLNLLRDENPPTYKLIVDTVKLVAPFFKDFKFRPRKDKEGDVIQLEWKQVGSDYPFHPNQLSDGTIRFIALTTALLQPNPPATVLIDEPELGLHPYALEILGSLIQQAQERTQLIVSTQSATLLNYFEPDQIVIVERGEGESKFRRIQEKELTSWLKDYTLGELWQKNIYGGGPGHE